MSRGARGNLGARLRAVAAPVLAAAALACAARTAAAAGYHLIDNFTGRLIGRGNVATAVDSENAKAGLGAARLTYTLDAQHRGASLVLPSEGIRLPGPGQLKLWVKGNATNDEMQLTLLHAEAFVDDRGNRRLRNHRRVSLERTRLDFDDWRELTLDPGALPTGQVVWWDRIDFRGRRKEDEPCPPVSVLLDDLRFVPQHGGPPATLATCLIGPPARDFGGQVAVALDVRSFVKAPASVQARVTITDRNENLVADRDFRVDLAPAEAKELRLELAPKNLEAYLPPFDVACDIVSADLPQLSQKTEHKLVMANSTLLFDDMSDALAHWFTAGFHTEVDRRTVRNWVGWTHGEAQRASPWAQTTAAIGRADIPNPTGQDKPVDPTQGEQPPGRFALRLGYTGQAFVYSARNRYLPGNAFRLGVWVKGNGTSDRLSVLILDYTDSADFWVGGWRRINDGELPLCTLDFTGWRYIEVPLPGNGLGSNVPRGSTPELNFPLEITAFRIQPPEPPRRPRNEKTPPEPPPAARGPVLLGPIVVHTQQLASGTLALHVGCDDPEHRYRPGLGAWLTVQNASPVRTRQVRVAWTLLDRSGEAIANGATTLELPPHQARTHRIDLAGQAPDAASRLGPFRLEVNAVDANDAGVAATQALAIAKPDSKALFADFEADRGYLGLKAYTFANAPPVGHAAARTASAQAHSGKRSLALAWDRTTLPPARHGQPPPRPLTIASIDPALPGVPVELSLWVHGDGSGALFYPLIGDTQGVSHGGHGRTFDLFLTRTAGGPLQNAVRVDWKGWRKLEFRLPVVPSDWHKPLPVLGFEPSYPLGLHLAVDGTGSEAERGTIYVDDVVVGTHLKPGERLVIRPQRGSETNAVAPGSPVSLVVVNRDAATPRAATLRAAVVDWRGSRVAAIEEALKLRPGERREFIVAKGLPVGAYALEAQLTAGEQELAALHDEIIVADLAPILGPEWQAALADEWKLRATVGDRYTFVDEDWDWVEHHPGNAQLDSLRQRARKVTERGADPYLLVGYCAYWAAGIGFEQMRAGAFVRRLRDAGHAVDTFLIPERDSDWDDYACALMREAGADVAGWVLWNNPDSGPIAVKPDRFARMLRSADRWRRIYCPDRPLLIGGMRRTSAIPYLEQLARHKALGHLTGVNVRLDVGRLSPEDARVPAYVRQLQAALGSEAGKAKSVLLSDLDWAVEKGPKGLTAFDQAAYLVRSELLLHQLGIRPALAVRNEDFARLGLGLTYRRELTAPPLTERPMTFQLKPAWWGVHHTRQWLAHVEPVAEIEIQDVVPHRTRCLLYKRKSDGVPEAAVWRNDDPGRLSFAATGLSVVSAEDTFGSNVPLEAGSYAVGRVPVFFVLKPAGEPAEQALSRVRVSDGPAPTWPQRVIAAFTPATGKRQSYTQTGGEAASFKGRTATGLEASWQGLRIPKGGVERFTIRVPQGTGLVLRKRYFLDDTGHKAEVAVNGRSAGTWDLTRTAPELASGLREGIFVVDGKALGGQAEARIEVRYAGSANTAGWRVFEYRGGPFPLSAAGLIHADQNVASPRMARNVVGAPLAVGEKRFANGVGVFAQSLLGVALNGQFARFSAQAGVDAVAEGRGSVVFEVYGDGKKLWASKVVSGLDEPTKIDVDVRGVGRLRLVVSDAGDGNKFDAANWCEPVLRR